MNTTNASGYTFTYWITDNRRGDNEGTGGVREPRRPITPPMIGGAALPIPREEVCA